MKKYIKRPVPIEAIMWTGKNEKEVLDFLEWKNAEVTEGEMYIFTLEGRMHVSLGDYVIKGTHGEFYPCRPEIFHSNYVEQEEKVNFVNYEVLLFIKHLCEDLDTSEILNKDKILILNNDNGYKFSTSADLSIRYEGRIWQFKTN